MASSEQLAAIDPWMFRSVMGDSWISESYARETDALTQALQQSLSNDHSGGGSPYFGLVKPEAPTTTPSSAQTPSGSGSDLDTAVPRRQNTVPGAAASRKITKRKSRASKRNTTTFIAADPANFRQMVQQVTGVRFGNGQMPVSMVPVLKPEAHRASFNRLQSCLPTLDTSAFLLDNQQQVVGPSSTTAIAQPDMDGRTESTSVADGGSSYDFEAFSSFPTLESWS